jgi:WD40 repeat protein
MRIEPLGNHHLFPRQGRSRAASCLGLALVAILSQPAPAAPLSPSGIFDTGNNKKQLNAVALSPDGKTVALAGHDPAPLTLFDISNGQKVPGPDAGPGAVSCLAFAPDGSSLAAGSAKGPTRLWKAGTWQLLHKLVHSAGTRHLAFAPGGKLLATVEYSNNVCLWDTASGKEVAVLPFQPSNWLCRVAFAPDGKALAAASSHGFVELHDLSGPAPLKDFAKKPRVLKCGAKKLSFVGFTPDSRSLVTVCDWYLVQIWDVATGALRREPLRPFKIHPNPPPAEFFPGLSPDGATLAVPGRDSDLDLIDLATGKTWAHVGQDSCGGHTIFSPDGAALITTGAQGKAFLFKVPKKP